MQVKFCGVARAEDVEAINELEPDYVGFVFWEHSKRFVTAEQARKLRDAMCPKIGTVGVFVDAPAKDIAQLFNDGIIGVAQLHGIEDDAFIEQLRSLAPALKIWKAIEVSNEWDIERANDSAADLVLLDGGKGEGNAFPWELLSAIKRPFALAGGLNELNLASALEHCNKHASQLPQVIDVSSGIEITDGDGRVTKCPTKTKRFIEIIRKGEC